jgi:hypothetical protein
VDEPSGRQIDENHPAYPAIDGHAGQHHSHALGWRNDDSQGLAGFR